MKTLPIFRKFLMSYMLLVALPTIILASVVTVFFYGTYLEENIKLFDEALAQQVEMFDESIDTLNKTTQSISYNPYLSEGYTNASVSNRMVSVQYIINYELANGFGAQIHVIHFGSDHVVTGQGTLESSYYLAKYNNDRLSPTQLRNGLGVNSRAYMLSLPDMTYKYSSTSYAYVTPLTNGVSDSGGCVLYLLQNNSVERYLNNLNSLMHSPAFILNENGELFAAGQGVSPELIEQALESDTPRFSHEGQSYYLLSRPSRKTGLTFYTIGMPYNLHSNFLLLIKIMAWCLVVIFAGASFLIYYFMKVNYRPIRILERTALADQSVPARDVTLQSVVSSISERLTTLSNYYTDSLDQRSNNMLLGLLTGSTSTAEAIEQDKAECGFSPEGNFFAAAALKFEKLSSADKEMLREHVSDFVAVKCYPVDVYKKNSLSFIFTCDSDSPQLLYSAVQSLHRGIKNLLGCVLTVGVGTWVDNPLEIYNSYLNALSSLEARLIKGLDSIIMYDEISSQTGAAFQYPHMLVEQFKNALLSNNRSMIMDSIDNIFAKIKSSDTAIITIRTFCYNITQIAVKNLSGSGGRQVPPQDSLNAIHRLMEAETVDTLAQSLKEICDDYLTQQGESPATGGSHLGEMIAYIEENYCDPDFSLQCLADRFKLSPSYISRYFAAQNGGVSMLEHTNRLRMEKAKKLLSGTALPIPDIARQVAFLNLSSFNRKFKQMVGVPPGLYRQQCSRAREDGEADAEADKPPETT